MFVCSVVRLVKHEQADVATKLDVAMAERVKEHVGRAHDDAVLNEHPDPQLPVFPLVRLVCAGNEPDSDGNVRCDDGLLLPRKCDGRCEEPGDLSREKWVGHWYAGQAYSYARAHTLRDLCSVSCFIRRTAM